MRDMRGLHVFQGRQQAARVGARVAVAFELGDELALPRDVSLALGDMAVGRCQVAQNCAAIQWAGSVAQRRPARQMRVRRPSPPKEQIANREQIEYGESPVGRRLSAPEGAP